MTVDGGRWSIAVESRSRSGKFQIRWKKKKKKNSNHLGKF